ncbi:MAG: hypothetical protein RQ966_12840 [Acetobacteraceae bacterium]|nr:hypothetical protein [Acetobacteraceae bacterium]
MVKPVSLLGAVKATKPAAAAPAPAETPADAGPVKHVMVRLNPAAHDLLRKLSYVQRRPQSALLVEALNDLFVKNGEPPLAG